MFCLNYLLLGRNPDIEYITSLSIDECIMRLTQELQRRRRIFGFQSPPPTVERLMENRFLITRNQSFLYRDNFLVLDGQLKTTGDGALVSASFRLYDSTSITLILGFVLFFGLAANEVITNGVEIGLLLIPIVFWGILGLVLWLMIRLSKSKRDGLASYLQSILTPVANSNG